MSTLTLAERDGDTQRERKTGQLGHPQIKIETDMWKHTELRERHTLHQHVVYMLDVSTQIRLQIALWTAAEAVN